MLLSPGVLCRSEVALRQRLTQRDQRVAELKDALAAKSQVYDDIRRRYDGKSTSSRSRTPTDAVSAPQSRRSTRDGMTTLTLLRSEPAKTSLGKAVKLCQHPAFRSATCYACLQHATGHIRRAENHLMAHAHTCDLQVKTMTLQVLAALSRLQSCGLLWQSGTLKFSTYRVW